MLLDCRSKMSLKKKSTTCINRKVAIVRVFCLDGVQTFSETWDLNAAASIMLAYYCYYYYYCSTSIYWCCSIIICFKLVSLLKNCEKWQQLFSLCVWLLVNDRVVQSRMWWVCHSPLSAAAAGASAAERMRCNRHKHSPTSCIYISCNMQSPPPARDVQRVSSKLSIKLN